MTAAIETRGLLHKFGAFTALSDVDLVVQPLERRAIIGPNGAGKSTLFNVLTGHLRPTAGAVRLFGTDVTGHRPDEIARAGVGRSFQVTSVFPSFSVLQNVQCALICRERRTRNVVRRAWKMMTEEAEEILDAVGLTALRHVAAGELSHGDQRSLELALSLALRPRLLMLDEPTAGMAPEETQRAMALVRRLAEDYELTLLFTEHDMDVVFATADRVTVLASGEIISDGSSEKVRQDPEVRRVYLGENV